MFPAGVTTVYNSVFANNKLTSVKMSSETTTILYEAFWGNSGLTALVIPSKVVKIEARIAAYLQSVYMEGNAPTIFTAGSTSHINGSFGSANGLKIYYKSGKTGYNTGRSWNGYATPTQYTDLPSNLA